MHVLDDLDVGPFGDEVRLVLVLLVMVVALFIDDVHPVEVVVGQVEVLPAAAFGVWFEQFIHHGYELFSSLDIHHGQAGSARQHRYHAAGMLGMNGVGEFAAAHRDHVAEGLSIEAAIEHVTGTEASSETACKSLGKARTRRCGRWFDSYKEE